MPFIFEFNSGVISCILTSRFPIHRWPVWLCLKFWGEMASGYPSPMVHLDIRLSSKPPWSIIVRIMCFISLLRAILSAHFGYSSLMGAHFYPIGSHIIISWVHKGFPYSILCICYGTSPRAIGADFQLVASCLRMTPVADVVQDVSEGPVVGHLLGRPWTPGHFSICSWRNAAYSFLGVPKLVTHILLVSWRRSWSQIYVIRPRYHSHICYIGLSALHL